MYAYDVCVCAYVVALMARLERIVFELVHNMQNVTVARVVHVGITPKRRSANSTIT